MFTWALLCLLAAGQLDAQSGASDSTWVGALRLSGPVELVIVTFRGSDSVRADSISFPTRGPGATASLSRASSSGRIKLEWSVEAGATTFDGREDGGRILGVARRGTKSGSLELIRTAVLDPGTLDRYAGWYEIRPGRVVSISRRPAGLVFLDFRSGETRMLFPLSASHFVGGPAAQIPAPIDLAVDFDLGGGDGAARLSWRWANQPLINATRVSISREEVTFANGDVRLAGTLYLPRGNGPHPAIVRIHGAGPADRHSGAAELYAYHGIAFLTYDKRGVGGSSGDWRKAGIEDLAKDALAAVQYLRTRPDVEPKRIGLGAGSEGGWAAPWVAAHDPDLGFILTVMGPALSYADELQNELADHLRERGSAAGDVTAALEFQRRYLTLVKSGVALAPGGWDQVRSLVAGAHEAAWLRDVRPPPAPDWRQEKLALMLPFDPTPLWEKTRIPVFAVYGERDRNVPAAKNVIALRRALQRAGNPDFEIVVLPKANHEGIEAERGYLDDAEMSRLHRFSPGYFYRPLDWIVRRVGPTRARTISGARAIGSTGYRTDP